jgi:TIR domain
MKIFLSWSGERSKFIAEALRNWLPNVIQVIEPWMSNEDIKSGGRWSSEIMTHLEASKFGIICLTPENQNNPWIMFESGALSKTIAKTFVCPLLYEMNPSEIVGPLSQFQANELNKEGLFRIVSSINDALGHQGLKKEKLDETYSVWWPQLKEKLAGCPPYDGKKVPKRSQEDILNEIVNNTREQLRREEVRLKRGSEMESKLRDLLGHFSIMVGQAQNPESFNQIQPNSTTTLTDVVNELSTFQEIDDKYTKELFKKSRTNKRAKK